MKIIAQSTERKYCWLENLLLHESATQITDPYKYVGQIAIWTIWDSLSSGEKTVRLARSARKSDCCKAALRIKQRL